MAGHMARQPLLVSLHSTSDRSRGAHCGTWWRRNLTSSRCALHPVSCLIRTAIPGSAVLRATSQTRGHTRELSDTRGFANEPLIFDTRARQKPVENGRTYMTLLRRQLIYIGEAGSRVRGSRARVRK